MKNYISCFLILFFLFSCKSNETKSVKNTVKFYHKGAYLVKETFDSIGKIQTKQYFNNDTIPDGALIEYYSNGNIGSWQLYSVWSKKRVSGVFYNLDGSFDTLKGHSFLDTTYHASGNIAILLISPPNLKNVILFEECYHNKMIKREFYDPIKTDTLNWLVLGKLKYVKNHIYKLYFCNHDTIAKKLAIIDSMELKNFNN